MGRNIPEREMKSLIALSGGVCAFPRCDKRLVTAGTDIDSAVFLGEMAHIVADSRQGPRGDSDLSDDERDRHTNLLLLCGDHHKTIDSQPLTFSVPVLRRMKQDHESRIQRSTGVVSTLPVRRMEREVIHSSLFSVTHLPAAVFAAPCALHDGQDDLVKQRLHFPESGSEMVRFILREGRLFSFHNLRNPDGPFRDVIQPKLVETIRAEQWWDDPEGHRRYLSLLNRGLYKFAARKRVRFDPAHKRFFFDALMAGKPRQEYYRPLNAKGRSKRNVVWQPTSKATGEARGFWWHLAASLSLQRVGTRQWCFAIRPERHLTSDGVTPLPPRQIGRRVTSKKARMWNDLYLGEVNFWRDYLSDGRPTIVLNFGDQSAIIGTTMLTFEVNWPGIPGDSKPFSNQTYDQDLFSNAEYEEALSGDHLEWEDDDETSEGDEGY